MNHLVIFEAWKLNNDESTNIDKKNIEEIKDMMYDLIDNGAEIIGITADGNINEFYRILYFIENNLSITLNVNWSNGTRIGTKDNLKLKIKESKDQLEILNMFITESHNLLERLSNCGYDINYFSVQERAYENQNGDPRSGIMSEICISR